LVDLGFVFLHNFQFWMLGYLMTLPGKVIHDGDDVCHQNLPLWLPSSPSSQQENVVF
jgi:hypothetical protein